MPTKERLLIIEDSLFFSNLLFKKLSAQTSLIIDVAHSFEEALELIQSHSDNIFLALVDLNLPDAPNGEIVGLVAQYNIPFVVFTADEGDMMKNLCERHSMLVDYVNKQYSFSIDYLLNLIVRLKKNTHIKVLIVDDSKVSRARVVRDLSRTMLNTLEASNSAEALEILKQGHNIRLVMIDNYMPDKMGYDLCKEIRKLFSTRKMSIIGFSSESDSALASKFLKSGANDFLNKYCSQEELLCRVTLNLDMQEYIHAEKEAANRDHLTGIYNRRFLDSSIKQIQANAKRSKEPYAIAVLDIDDFKQINDTQGHDAGDTTIITLANELQSRLRESDLIARIGGEEFCIIAPACDLSRATHLFNKLKHDVEHELHIHHQQQKIDITISIGVCCDSSLDFKTMLKIADTNMYKAKDAGKNQVIIS